MQAYHNLIMKPLPETLQQKIAVLEQKLRYVKKQYIDGLVNPSTHSTDLELLKSHITSLTEELNHLYKSAGSVE